MREQAAEEEEEEEEADFELDEAQEAALLGTAP
eukprot:COSAG01_NODE_35898_length_525_cov_0.697183_1_plen_32_part_10